MSHYLFSRGRLRRRGDRARTLAAAFLARHVCRTDHADRLGRRAGGSRASARGPAAAAVLGRSSVRAAKSRTRTSRRSAPSVRTGRNAAVARRRRDRRRQHAPAHRRHQPRRVAERARSAHAADRRARSRARFPSQRVVADARDDRVLVSTREQKLVANFIARRYRVAQEPVSELVTRSVRHRPRSRSRSAAAAVRDGDRIGLQSVCGKRRRRARA